LSNFSQICYKESENVSSTNNSNYEEDEEDEEEKETLKIFENTKQQNNRYEKEESKDEDAANEESEETVQVLVKENESFKKSEEMSKRREEIMIKVDELKKQCKKIIGEQKFNKIYQFYLTHCEKNKELDNTDNDKINDYIYQEVNMSQFEFMSHFCQLVYYELQLQYVDQELSKVNN